MSVPPLKRVLEAALAAAGEPVTLDRLGALFPDAPPEPEALRAALDELAEEWQGRSVELVQVAGGYRLQVRSEFAPWVSRLWEERPGRYSRALLETLALVAWRQPITRGDIEAVRGVSVSSGIVRTLLERGWIRVVGHRDVPGRPALYATTRDFLDYFNLHSLADLPPLPDPGQGPSMQEQDNAGAPAPEEGGGDDGTTTEVPR